jgi:PEP-CTERM motif
VLEADGVAQPVMDTYFAMLDRRFDFNHDGVVSDLDYQLLQQHQGAHDWMYNLTDSGTVSRQDKALFANEFPIAGAAFFSEPVPEPATVVLTLLGAIGTAVFVRRRANEQS